MKYLIVSDNHGDRDSLLHLFQLYQNQVDAVFHCGDSELEVTDVIWHQVHVVKGNCDYSSQFSDKKVIQIGEDRILLTHGHLYNVKMDLTTLDRLAEKEKTTIVLYGHTHVLDAQLYNQKLFLNPGSILLPRGKYPIQTYAILESGVDQYEISYFDRTNQLIPELSLIYTK